MTRYGPPDFRIISYAGNAEDVVLMRAFAKTQTGFFVDVGAADAEIERQHQRELEAVTSAGVVYRRPVGDLFAD
ncbi:hypothetical protein [Streptacidiphilus rugosus]|uniref:hypothetical protein n=1 Tax=Streptacidiphilus rugosus TaxID=405783 RepID=UPI0012F961BD|nr:hypothetical protein [Streptacidiphilus rugosus]